MKKVLLVTIALSAVGVLFWQGHSIQYVRGEQETNTRAIQGLSNYLIKLGTLAPPPSVTEGTTTAGWTDDGSVVRLNTSSDFVGIGTLNPPEKLSVVGGNAYISGTLAVSGSTFNFGSGSATSTLSTSSGFFGIGTSTPRQFFSVHGHALIAGTTTVQGLIATSTLDIRGTATSSFAGGINTTAGCFAINGTCVGGSSSGGSILLSAPAGAKIPDNATTTLANITVTANTFTTNEAIEVTISATTTKTSSSEIVPLNVSLSYGGNATATCGFRFNNDGSTNSFSATSTFTFRIRAISGTAQSNECTGLTFTQQTTRINTVNQPGGVRNATQDNKDFSSVSGSIDSSVGQPLILTGFVNHNTSWEGGFYGIIIQHLNL